MHTWFTTMVVFTAEEKLEYELQAKCYTRQLAHQRFRVVSKLKLKPGLKPEFDPLSDRRPRILLDRYHYYPVQMTIKKHIESATIHQETERKIHNSPKNRKRAIISSRNRVDYLAKNQILEQLIDLVRRCHLPSGGSCAAIQEKIFYFKKRGYITFLESSGKMLFTSTFFDSGGSGSDGGLHGGQFLDREEKREVERSFLEIRN
ncbi:hypothetical protein DM860_003304 [Cuscuta australis]|uniref:Uncharacterized protein n=1 Tax=Cuscuta australis TaxID=267555 RepID=A0A328D613_9ASTE|nr:hypothetical protein DM860_003304 [Cuscuta australis]